MHIDVMKEKGLARRGTLEWVINKMNQLHVTVNDRMIAF